MAMVKCRECGHDISNKAPACPNCGAVKAKSIPWIKWTFVACFGYFIYTIGVNYNTYTTAASGATRSTTAKLEAADSTPIEHWRFHESVDKMSGEKSQFIFSNSKNTLNGWLRPGKVLLGYSCTNKQIYVRANDLGFHMDDFDCSEYGCSRPQYTRAKFDDKPPQNLVFDIWDDDHDGMSLTNKRNINGLTPDEYMLSAMKSSNELLLELKLFNTKGVPQIAEFSLQGFSSNLSKCK